ncbi:MAG: hypothetical protein ACOX63_03980 [Christensenellales bacterium]|jgi:hypothetical protein
MFLDDMHMKTELNLEMKKQQILDNLPLLVAVCITIISQVEGIPFQNIIRVGMYAIWVVVGLYYIAIKKARVYSSDLCLFIPAFLTIGISLLLSVFVHNYRFPDDIMKIYGLATLLLMLGRIIARLRISLEEICLVLAVYVFMSVILALYIIMQVWSGISNWLGQVKYLYDSKNSASQILASAVIILISVDQNQRLVFKFVRWVFICGLLFVILYIQARATIIGLFVSFLSGFLLFSRYIRRQKMQLLLGLFLAFSIIIMTIPSACTVFSKIFRLNEGTGFSINEFTSSRLTKYREALQLWLSSPLFGIGDGYVDNFIINLLMNGGIMLLMLVGVPTYYITSKAIYKHATCKIHQSRLSRPFVCLNIFFLTISVFEAHAPLGPGACTFILWLLLGFMFEKGQIINRKVVRNSLAE